MGSVYMKVVRARITAYTASFRYPIFISGFQPSLPVPPLSTIYGFLSAVTGKIVTPEDTSAGYVFSSKGKFVDIETVYELEGFLRGKSNICKREILAEPEMYLYVTNIEYYHYFKKPSYPLLLGRSTDLCMVDDVKIIDLRKTPDKIKVGKCIIPFKVDGVFGTLQSLPSFLTKDIPRQAEDTQIYYIVEDFIEYEGKGFLFDEEMNWGVYMHDAKASLS
jgi:CRISPR-associated protein Cas5t